MAVKLVTKEKKGESSNLNVSGGKPVELKIAYIGGGSRGWAHALMGDLVQTPHFNGEVRLYDINHPMAEFNAKYGNWLQDNPRAVSKWKYRAVRSLKETLSGADFVFLSIQPGRIEDMGVDLLEPMKYGIFQPVGDTVGPGGSIRSLRTIKDYLGFAAAIKKYAPKAYCLNFTNPMTICTRTLYEGFPGIKAWGCCHEVFGTQRLLAEMYALETGENKPERGEIRANILGINHFTWITKAECRGTDVFKLFMKHVNDPKIVSKFGKVIGLTREGSMWKNAHQVGYELSRRFGVIAAAGDRHLSEFVPYFLTDRDSCLKWGFGLTPYSYRINRFRNAPKQTAKVLKSGIYPEINASGEEYMNQMLAVLGKTTFVTNVNMPNCGQHAGLPLGAVVETNAVFSEGGASPVYSGGLPDGVNTLVYRHVVNQETLVKAVVSRSKELAFRAFINDVLVSRLPTLKAQELFESMIKKTRFKF